MYYERGGVCLDNVTLPARLVTHNRLRPRHHGLIPVHLVKCLFLLSLPFLCVAYSCAVVDKKDHTTGAIQWDTSLAKRDWGISLFYFCNLNFIFFSTKNTCGFQPKRHIIVQKLGKNNVSILTRKLSPQIRTKR
jgi:hypothetical protein